MAAGCGRTRRLWRAGDDLKYLGLVAADSKWLRESAMEERDSLLILPLADSLARPKLHPE